MVSQKHLFIGLAGGIFAALIALLVMTGILLGEFIAVRDNGFPMVDTACPQGDTCQTGMSIKSAGVKHCQVYNDTIGTACSSACYVADTATTCDSYGLCGSSNSTACKGACVATSYDFPLVEFNSPSCEDLLTFFDFFVWNTATSSSSLLQWVFYSDYSPDCNSIFGCRGYASYIMAYLPGVSAVDWSTNAPSELNCLDILNMTNKECIQSKSFLLSEDISTPLYRTILQPFTVTNLSTWRFQVNACLYWYKCGVINASALTDPVNLLGEITKRSLPSTTAEAPNFVKMMFAHGDKIGKKLGPHMANIIEEHEKRVFGGDDEYDV